ncbi:hypothetical protein [Catenulispora rubra]|uniref:hypothetical protein n=1 Tax=Catenulispora rubra TaxID=280293 RepID=UPI0018920629|nr:hypothetical protein [Catenulispora rubra]
MSALYPAPSTVATSWLATLRTTLARLAGQVREGPPIDVESLAAQLESESPEAAELGSVLGVMLEEFEDSISGLTEAFGLVPSTLLIALGRGEEIGELDPVVAGALGDVGEVRALTSSGTVTIEKDGRSTTLIAATTVGAPVGPVRIAWPGREDVWLCAVASKGGATVAARAALERILPHVGVSRAHLRTAHLRTAPARPPQNAPTALHAALLAIDPIADPDLVMARLEGWRAALEQLHRGAVAIHWEQS